MALAEIGKSEQMVGTRRSRSGRLGLAIAHDPDAYKAGALATLSFLGPDAPVRCPVHQFAECGLVPVSWALLGHTCGRAA